MRRPVITLVLLVPLSLSAWTLPVTSAQQGRNLTYEEAFGRGAGGPLDPMPTIRWIDDNHYRETRGRGDQRRVRIVSAADGSSRPDPDPPAAGRGTGARSASVNEAGDRVVLRDGDLYYRPKEGAGRRLTATAADEQNPRFSPNGRNVAYTRLGDLFVYDLDAGLEKQLTSDGSDTVYNGYASWVYFEEILGRAGRYRAFWWSPDSTRLAFLRFDDSPVPVFPIYWADGQHGRLERQHYPKAGDPNPWVSLGIVTIADGETIWADFEQKADHYIAWPFWTPDSGKLTAQWMNRGQDTIRLYNVDPETGGKTRILEERQSAWVSWFKDLTYLEDGTGFLIRSDVDGWDHLYYYANDGSLRKRLTEGEWRVTSIARVDEESRQVYFMARKGAMWDSQLMRIGLDGSGLTELTHGAGSHSANISPDGSYFIDTVSTVSTPSVMRLYRIDGTLVREVASAAGQRMGDFAWGKAELFTIPSGDGYDLPAWWVLPPDFDPDRRYPVLFSIYGGPDAGRVRNRWLGTTPHYWAQRGLITISVDHRASGHFGKKGVALMHRQLGRWEMHDLIAAARWLRDKPFVDPERIGITGGSYGGYTTLMALTHGAEHFNFGVARSSVTDWRLYDTVYTERYMDTPAENPEGYEKGRVLHWIERYKGRVLITHGTIDDNVHMQNSIQVVDWLTSHDKAFEMMLYPDSRHGFQAAQRPHSTRETHDFWMRTLLAPPAAAATDRDHQR